MEGDGGAATPAFLIASTGALEFNNSVAMLSAQGTFGLLIFALVLLFAFTLWFAPRVYLLPFRQRALA